MTNYNGEKGKRLRGSMAPKSDDEVALAGTNSGETEEKQEALSGTNSGEEKEVENLTDEVKEKFEELTSKKEHKD